MQEFTGIVEKKKCLESAGKVLKKEFVGLNSVIDEIINLVEPWYLFPELQFRPLVINLWGMTGTGKTALVKRLSQLISMDNYTYKFDVGDYNSSDTKLKYELSDNLKEVVDKPVIFVFDEFQLGRTINEREEETLDKNGLRALWELIDSGIIDVIPDSYDGGQIYRLYQKLDDCIFHGVRAVNGVVTEGERYWESLLGTIDDDDEGEYVKPSNSKGSKKKKDNILIPTRYISSINNILYNERHHSPNIYSETKNKLRKLDERESLEFIKRILDVALKPIEYKFNQSLIFIIGNLDEAYYMTRNLSPDSDVDRLHEHSSKITLPDIKNALLSRFRSEQIARLGNNHIIYKCLNSKSYKEIIRIELVKSINKFESKFGVLLEIDSSVDQIIYKEGVFPTQGVRPLFGTISNLVESYFGKIIYDIILSKKDISKVVWRYKKEKYHISYQDNQGEVFNRTFKLSLKVESLRKSDNDESQATTAIHEAGHAITSVYVLDLLPREILSKTADSDYDGWCSIDVPPFLTKEASLKDAVCELGGYAAELLVFGEDNLTNGAKQDIMNVTEQLVKMGKSYGMFGKVYHINHPDFRINSQSITSSKDIEEVEEVVKKCLNMSLEQAIECLKREKLLLLKMGEYLTKHSRMNDKQIKHFIKKYAVDKKTVFKNKDNYYKFKSIIQQQIKTVNGEG